MSDIGWAKSELVNGRKVRRAGWNGRGMFLIFVPGSTFTVEGQRPIGMAAPELVGQPVNYLSHVDMRTAQGDFVPWLCSQTDFLSEDWESAD